MNRELPVQSEGGRRSRGGSGCLSFSTCRVSSFAGAGASSRQIMRITALKFPALSFERIAATRCWSASFTFRGCLL